MVVATSMAPLYEMFCVVTPRLGAAGVQDTLLKCGRRILAPAAAAAATAGAAAGGETAEATNGGGVVTEVSSFGQKKLAYELRERSATFTGKHANGWLARMRFVCAPEVAREVEAMLRRDEAVLRHIVRREKRLVPSLRRENLLEMRRRTLGRSDDELRQA